MKLRAAGPLIAGVVLAGCASAPPPDESTHSRVTETETPGEAGSVEVRAERRRDENLTFTGYAISLRGVDGGVRSDDSCPAVFTGLAPGTYDVAVGTFEDPQGMAQVRVTAGRRAVVNFSVAGATGPPKPGPWDPTLDAAWGATKVILGTAGLIALLLMWIFKDSGSIPN